MNFTIKNNFLTILLFLTLGLFMASCDKDETCSDGVKNQDETGVDCGGVCEACATCDDGIKNGDETDVDCGGVDCEPCLVGVQGDWTSEGDDIAVLLRNFASKIEADFNSDGTYTVLQTDTSGAQFTLQGTYTQTESSVDGIWNIVLNQTTPTTLTAEGIFSVDTDNDRLTYEVVQTDPSIGATPPTADAGFGSTSGGVFGTANVQYYNRD